MIDLTLDWETFFSKDYSLKKMTTREYVMDSRFEPLCLGVAEEGKDAFCLEPEDIEPFLRSVDWGNVRLSGHNLMFDGAILAWRYGIYPKIYECTMYMAQGTIAHALGGAGLDTINKFFGLTKDSDALMHYKGFRVADIDRSAPEWQRFKAYAKEDAAQSRMHASTFRKLLSRKERLVIDTLIRMYIESPLRLDRAVLWKNLEDAKAERERLFTAAGVTSQSDITSRDKFAKLLEMNGVTPPQKISERTGKPTWAFSKKDLKFLELQEHPDEKIRALVEARLNAASSLEETRTKRFMALADIGEGLLNVPITYSGAHTHRFSGRDNINLQNLPRGSQLRYAITAPPKHKVIVVDASQIEARLLAWVAGAMSLVTKFQNKEDVYSSFASDVFQFPVNKNDHPEERFIGKTGILGLGYQTGVDKLHTTLHLAGRRVSKEFCKQAVDTYRNGYPEIPAFWKECEQAIKAMANGVEVRIGPMLTRSRYLLSPSGLKIFYPHLKYHEMWNSEQEQFDKGYYYWRYRYKSWAGLYGGALTENIIQHLARLQITDTMVKMRLTEPRWFCAMQVHDELVYVAPEDEAEDCYNHLMKYMCEQPDWASYKDYPIPFAAEGSIGDDYGSAK